jgi:hypothetical protein
MGRARTIWTRYAVSFAAVTGLALAIYGGVATAPPLPTTGTTQATQVAKAVLVPQNGSGVNGQATLLWNPTTDVLTVTVMARGLAPGTTHPNHIHVGSCPSPGAIVYPLTDLVANPGAVAQATTTFNGVDSVEFHGGWAWNVHQGPTLTAPGGATSIACGDVVSH